MQTLLQRYSAVSDKVRLEDAGGYNIYHLDMKVDVRSTERRDRDDEWIHLVVDADGFPDRCPRVRVYSPVFKFDGRYPVRGSGLVVVEGVTPLTWSGGDFIELLYNALSKDVPEHKRGSTYPSDDYYTDSLLVETPLESEYHLTYGRATLGPLKGNSISVNDDHDYVLVQSHSGIKTACAVVGRTPEVKVSQTVFDNLLGQEDIAMVGINPPIAVSLVLRRETSETCNPLCHLNDYEILTIGDTITLGDGTYLVKDLKPGTTCLLISDKNGSKVAVTYESLEDTA